MQFLKNFKRFSHRTEPIIVTRKRIFVCFIIVSTYFYGCSGSQPIKPISEGTSTITASFGGPIIPLDGIAIPAPYIIVGSVHGIKKNISIYGNVHITAALFKDVGIDGGFVTTLVEEEGAIPAIHTNGRIYFFWDVGRSNNKRIFPMATVIASYAAGTRSLFYFGADNLFQVHKPDYFISPLIGYQFPLNETILSQIEVKWLAANKDTRHGVFEGTTSISGYGGVGLFFGIQYSLR